MADPVPLSWPEDSARVLDLCMRAQDYVLLETGAAPDMAYVHETSTTRGDGQLRHVHRLPLGKADP